MKLTVNLSRGYTLLHLIFLNTDSLSYGGQQITWGHQAGGSKMTQAQPEVINKYSYLMFSTEHIGNVFRKSSNLLFLTIIPLVQISLYGTVREIRTDNKTIQIQSQPESDPLFWRLTFPNQLKYDTDCCDSNTTVMGRNFRIISNFSFTS